MTLLKYGWQPAIIGILVVLLVTSSFLFSVSPLLIFMMLFMCALIFFRHRIFESILIFFMLSMSLEVDGKSLTDGVEDIFTMRIGGVSLFFILISILIPASILYFKRINVLILKLLVIYICIFIYCLALTLFTDIIDQIFLFKFKYYINIILLLLFCLFITKDKAQFVLVSSISAFSLLGVITFTLDLGYYYGGEFFYSLPSSVLFFVFLPFCSFLSSKDKLLVFSLLLLGVSLSLIPFTGKAIVFTLVGLVFSFYNRNKLLSFLICLILALAIPLYVDSFVSLLGTWGLHNTAYKLQMIFNVVNNPLFIYKSLNTSVGSTLVEVISTINWLSEPYNLFGRGFSGYLTDPVLSIIGEDGFNEFSLQNNLFYSLHMPWLNLILALGIFVVPLILLVSNLIESRFLLFVYFFIFAVSPQLSLMLILLIVSDNVKEESIKLRF